MQSLCVPATLSIVFLKSIAQGRLARLPTNPCTNKNNSQQPQTNRPTSSTCQYQRHITLYYLDLKKPCSSSMQTGEAQQRSKANFDGADAREKARASERSGLITPSHMRRRHVSISHTCASCPLHQLRQTPASATRGSGSAQLLRARACSTPGRLPANSTTPGRSIACPLHTKEGLCSKPPPSLLSVRKSHSASPEISSGHTLLLAVAALGLRAPAVAEHKCQHHHLGIF